MAEDELAKIVLDNPGFFETAITAFPSSQDGASFLFDIANAQIARWHRTGLTSDIDQAVAMLTRVITMTPKGHPGRTKRLLTFVKLSRMRFHHRESLEDIDRIIECLDEVLATTETDDPARIGPLTTFRIALLHRGLQLSSFEDFDHAIKVLHEEVLLTRQDQSAHINRVCDLGQTLLTRFARTGSAESLDIAIANFEHTDVLTRSGHPERPRCLDFLSAALQLRWNRANSSRDLNVAVMKSEEAVELTSHNTIERAVRLDTLGSAFRQRFNLTRSIEDLERAIQIFEEIVRDTPILDRNRPVFLIRLGEALLKRFERTEVRADLDQAIELMEEGLRLATNVHPEYAGFQISLAGALYTQFVRTRSTSSLNRAIELQEAAVALTPDSHYQKVARIMKHVDSLQQRFKLTGTILDLDLAITKCEQAVAFASNDPVLLANVCNDFSVVLHLQYGSTGSLETQSRAIEMGRSAVMATSIDHPDRTAYLNNLGNALASRFAQTGAMDDLDKIIAIREQVLLTVADYCFDRPGYLNNLAGALQSRFEQSGSMEDLERAIVLMEEAIASTPPDHITWHVYMMTLQDTLFLRFERTGSENDLDRSIEMCNEMLDLVPNDHALLSRMGMALVKRFQRTGLAKALEGSINMQEQAIRSLPPNNPDLTFCYNNLGSTYYVRFKTYGLLNDLECSIKAKEDAVSITSSPPLIRVRTASSAAEILLKDGHNTARANLLLQRAVELLPLVTPRSISQRDQQRNIGEFVGLTSMAVSVAIECGEKPYDILRLLELGRGVIASWQLESRSDISVLKGTHPKLAMRLEELRGKLCGPRTHCLEPKTYLDSDGERRKIISAQLEELLRRIRRLNGFEQFLLGITESEWRTVAEKETIVLFNISGIRSDAFLINKKGVRLLSLTSLKLSDLMAYAERFLNAISTATADLRRYRGAKFEMCKVLEWLWDVAIDPILEALGFTKTPDGTWPRVWWVPNGLLNILPIHASGYHGPGSTRTVIDRVISSYVPTVKSLVYARERHARASTIESQKAMLVGMPKTPGCDDLPGVQGEIGTLKSLISPSISTTVFLTPRKEDVLAGMHDHQIVHLSCHGQIAPDPSQSKLLLTDWKTTPLTMVDLMAANLEKPQFAYLSACNTAHSTNPLLLDESIHIASAIHLAGYPSVIATLWAVADEHCENFAKTVYEFMLDGGRKLDNGRSAEGLHRAVRMLRDGTRVKPGFTIMTDDDPLVWAPYIHIGV